MEDVIQSEAPMMRRVYVESEEQAVYLVMIPLGAGYVDLLRFTQLVYRADRWVYFSSDHLSPPVVYRYEPDEFMEATMFAAMLDRDPTAAFQFMQDRAVIIPLRFRSRRTIYQRFLGPIDPQALKGYFADRGMAVIVG